MMGLFAAVNCRFSRTFFLTTILLLFCVPLGHAETYTADQLPDDLKKAAVAYNDFPTSLNKLTDLSSEFASFLLNKQGYTEYGDTLDGKEYLTYAKKDDDGNISTKTFRTITDPKLRVYPVGFEFKVVMENGQLKGLETNELSEEEINVRSVMHSYDPAHLKQVTESAKEKLNKPLLLPTAKSIQNPLNPPTSCGAPSEENSEANAKAKGIGGGEETKEDTGKVKASTPEENPQAQGEKKDGDSPQGNPEHATEGPSPASSSDFDTMLSSVDSMLKSNDVLLTKLEQLVQTLDDLANKILSAMQGSAQPGAAVTSNTATAEQLREQAAGLNRQARHQELTQSLRQSSEKAREAKGKSDQHLARLEAMVSRMEDARVSDEKIKPHREKLAGLRARSESLNNSFDRIRSRLEKVSASTPTLTDETIKIEEGAVAEANKSFAEFETEATSLEEQLKKLEEELTPKPATGQLQPSDNNTNPYFTPVVRPEGTS